MLTITWSWPIPEPTRQLYRCHSVGELAVLNPWRAVDPDTLEFDPERFKRNVDARARSKDDDDVDVDGVPEWWDGNICIDFEDSKTYRIMGPIWHPMRHAASKTGRSMTTYRDTVEALRARNPNATLLAYNLRTSSESNDPQGAALERLILEMVDGVVVPMYLPGDPDKDKGRMAYQDRMLKWCLEEKVKRPELLVMPVIWKRRMSGAMANPEEWASVLERATVHHWPIGNSHEFTVEAITTFVTADGLILFEKSAGWSETEDAEFLRQIVKA